MKNHKTITEGIREITRTGEYEIYQGKVTHVDDSLKTVDIELEPGLTIFSVRLRAAVTDDSGVYVLPSKDSWCVIARIEMGQDYTLLRASKIDAYYIKIDGMTLEVSKDAFTFNGGQLKGMVKIQDLVQKLNALENKVNQIVTWTGTHLHSGNGAGTATPVTGSLATTKVSDLENKKILQ